MTKEELDLYIELAPILNEYRGEWQHGDHLYSKGLQHDFYCQDCLDYKIFPRGIYDDCIWLPLPIDPVHPERGLVGMIGKEFSNLAIDDGQWYCGIWTKKEAYINQFYGPTPTLALLKALKAQQGPNKI